MLRIAIVGGGAAGIMAAIVAKTDKTKVDIFEKNSQIGKKISISGNGRCNISNTNLSIENFSSQNLSFVKEVFKRFGFKDFEAFCKRVGIFLKVEDDGKVYPLSNSAKSLLEVLKSILDEKGVGIYLESEVKGVKKEDDRFLIEVGNDAKEYDRVLICCGSYAAEHLGGSLDGYETAKGFGHAIKQIYPSLVQLESPSAICKRLAGVKMDALVSLVGEDRQTQGDVLFTKYGLSGFAILDMSHYICRDFKDRSVTISINCLKDYDRSALTGELLKIKKSHPHYSALTLLSGFVNIKIAKALLHQVGIKEDEELTFLGIKDIKKIANQLLDWRFEVVKSHGFKYAEVCGGGVDTSQIEPKSMESKLVKGLYFAGEVLDVVGKRGGFNLAFAWSSGYIAGKHMKEVR